MTAALPPDLAVAYVTELSADVTAVVVVDADGRQLAGDPALAAAARAARRALAKPAAGGPATARRVASSGAGAAAAVRTGDRVVYAAAAASHTVLAVAGPLATLGPTLLDVRTAAAALAGADPKTLADGDPERLKTALEGQISVS